MSMPEPTTPPDPERPVVRSPRPDPSTTRTTRVVTWIGWHLAELVGVAVPLVLALVVWVWFAVPAGVVAVAWAAHEYREHGGGHE